MTHLKTSLENLPRGGEFKIFSIANLLVASICGLPTRESVLGSLARLAHCTIWTCDICKAATFEDYFDSVAHEEECAIANKVQEKTLSNKEGEELSNMSGD